MGKRAIAGGAVLAAALLGGPVLGASAQTAVTVPISPAPGFAVTGTATLTAQGTKTTVALQLRGYAPNTVHPTHFHTGTCAQAGPPVIPLPDLAADGTGTATATAEVDAPLATLTDGNHLVMSHVGPPPPVGPALVSVACGDVPHAAMAMPGALPRAGGPGPGAPLLAAAGALLAGALLRRRARPRAG